MATNILNQHNVLNKFHISTNSPQRLNEIVDKRFCKIVDISAPTQLRRRLFELGFIKGAIVQIINVSPMAHAYLLSVQNSLLCIRANILAHILVIPFDF